MKKQSQHFKLAICLFFLLTSCRSSTEITGSWKNPRQTSYSYDNIIVTALSSNLRAKTTVENDLATELGKMGITVLKGTEIFPPRFMEEEPEKDKILDEVRKNGANAIITINIVDKETESRYVPSTIDYAPFPRYSYYGRFGGYFSYWQPRVYSPGYYAEDKIYYLETNLYDVNSEQLIWSAQSETYNPSSLERFSENFAEVIVRNLRRENVL